jgi:hypothetical protein
MGDQEIMVIPKPDHANGPITEVVMKKEKIT